jgi:hypothetical protein
MNWTKELLGQYDVVQATAEAKLVQMHTKYAKTHLLSYQYMVLLLEDCRAFEAANERVNLKDPVGVTAKCQKKHQKDCGNQNHMDTIPGVR